MTREEVLRRHVWWLGYGAGLLYDDPACDYQCLHRTVKGGHCSRKAKRKLAGYPFCTQHYKMAQADLEKVDGGN